MAKYLVEASIPVKALPACGEEQEQSPRCVQRWPRGSAGSSSFYFGFGDRDAYVVVDLPDNEAAAAVALAVNAAGGATVKTTVLLTPEQVDEAAKRSVDYRPPGD